MYVQTLTSSIMEAVAESEAAIVAALSHRYTLKHVTTTEERVEQDMTASMRHRVQRPVHEANAVDQEDDDRGDLVLCHENPLLDFPDASCIVPCSSAALRDTTRYSCVIVSSALCMRPMVLIRAMMT